MASETCRWCGKAYLPLNGPDGSDAPGWPGCSCLDRLDTFAAAALTGLLARPVTRAQRDGGYYVPESIDGAAEHAYGVAEAMLRERARREGGAR